MPAGKRCPRGLTEPHSPVSTPTGSGAASRFAHRPSLWSRLVTHSRCWPPLFTLGSPPRRGEAMPAVSGTKAASLGRWARGAQSSLCASPLSGGAGLFRLQTLLPRPRLPPRPRVLWTRPLCFGPVDGRVCTSQPALRERRPWGERSEPDQLSRRLLPASNAASRGAGSPQQPQDQGGCLTALSPQNPSPSGLTPAAQQ